VSTKPGTVQSAYSGSLARPRCPVVTWWTRRRISSTARVPSAQYVALGVEHVVVINDRTPWQEACDLLRETKDALAHISGT